MQPLLHPLINLSILSAHILQRGLHRAVTLPKDGIFDGCLTLILIFNIYKANQLWRRAMILRTWHTHPVMMVPEHGPRHSFLSSCVVDLLISFSMGMTVYYVDDYWSQVEIKEGVALLI